MIGWYARRVAPFVLLMLAAAAFALFFDGPYWRGSWALTIDATAYSTTLTAPVVAVTAGWLALGDDKQRVLTTSTRRPTAVPLAGITAAWLAGVLVLAITGLTAVALTASVPGGGPWTPIQLGPALLLLLLGAAVGYAMVTWSPRLVVIIFLAPVMFVPGFISVTGLIPEWFRVGGATSLVSNTIDGHVIAVQGLALLALAVLAAVAAMAAAHIDAPALIAGLAVGVALLAVAVVGDHRYGDYPYPVAARKPDVCVGTTVVFCAVEEEQRPLASLAAQAAPMLDALATTGVRPVRRYEQGLSLVQPTPGAGTFYLTDYRTGDVAPSEVADALTDPGSCEQNRSELGPPTILWPVTGVLRAWLLRATGETAEFYDHSADAWLSGTRRSQAPWVATTYRALLSCDLDALRMPQP